MFYCVFVCEVHSLKNTVIQASHWFLRSFKVTTKVSIFSFKTANMHVSHEVHTKYFFYLHVQRGKDNKKSGDHLVGCCLMSVEHLTSNPACYVIRIRHSFSDADQKTFLFSVTESMHSVCFDLLNSFT